MSLNNLQTETQFRFYYTWEIHIVVILRHTIHNLSVLIELSIHE